MKLHFIVPLIVLSAMLTANAQVPVTVNRSTVLSGGSVVLPTITGSGETDMGYRNGATPGTGYCTGPTDTNHWKTVTGSAVSTACSVTGPLGGHCTLHWAVVGTPIATIATNAPSVFTNSCAAYVQYIAIPDGQVYLGSGSQSYIVTIVEDGGGGGSGTLPTATLTGMGDTLQGLSRRDATTDYRKILGFQLKANTNVVTSSIAIVLSNTTTNSPPDNNFLGIKLYWDDGSGEWDGSDTLLASTTNTSGCAIFNGLSIPLNSTNKTFFAAASFCPTNQTKNSFISATLRAQNIVTTIANTNIVIETTGGTVVGKQYAFLDTTQAEDDAYALSLTNGLVTASITNGLGNTSVYQTTTTGSKSGAKLSDTILPAMAAGAAGISAAFTSDQLSTAPLSQEYTPRGGTNPENSSEYTPRR